MFRPVPMMRLNLLVLERDERAVLRELGQAGAVQLVRSAASPETAPLPPRECAAELARCARLLARIEELRQSLEIAPGAAPAQAVAMDLDEAEAQLHALGLAAGPLLQRRQELQGQATGLMTQCERLSGYRGLAIPLDLSDHRSFLHFVTGTLPAAGLEQFEREMPGHVALLPLDEQEGRRRLIAMTTRQGRAALDEALQKADFEPETLPCGEGLTTDSLFEGSEHEREQVSSALEEIHAKLRALADAHGRVLAEVEEAVRIERSLLEAEQGFPRTEAAVWISGWAPATDMPALGRRLEELTQGRCVLETAAPESSVEEVPVLLRHPRVLRPFELLVSAYGPPSYRELEPTLFVAISYVLMFGMMFGDVGHGAILAVAGLAAFLRGRTETLRDTGLLLLFAGLASVVFGFLYGSCFGLAAFKPFALWQDPLEGNPMALMYGAMGIGVVMISLGLILNIINQFHCGDVIGGFLDKFGVLGLLFYWGALLLLTQFAALEARGMVRLAVLLFLVLPLVGWALKGPLQHFARRPAEHSSNEEDGGVAAIVLESVVGAFEGVLTYLANTISFVRLAAYAMSHAALLVAAFMLADTVRQVPTGGGVLSVLVIILGNVVAIVLEGIIASVQALRLEYYEFFGKFFSGSGQAFTPFRLTAARQLPT